MKKRIISVLLMIAVVMTTLSLSSCGSNVSKNPTRPDNIPEAETSEHDLDSDVYRTIAETDNVKFEFNDLTTDIRLTNKKTGYSWSTESEYDGFINRGEVFTLDYYTTTGTIISMSTAYDSVDKGQFIITDKENGVSVQYGLGDINYTINFPMAMSVERKEMYFAMMDEYQQQTFLENYTLVDFNDSKYEDTEEYTPAKIKELKKNYPLAADGTPWYYMSAGTSDKVLNTLNDLWVDQLGYTKEDYAIDNEGVNVPSIDRAEFNVVIDYTLEGDNLRVDIPEDQIYYDKDYTIETIQLHPGLMDFDNQYSGYYTLPDGSGSLLNFNNGNDEIRNDAIYIQMYGVDDARGVDERTAYYNDAILPVYGCTVRGKNVTKIQKDASGNLLAVDALTELTKDTDTSKFNGLFATVESGESFCGIEAHSGSPVEATHNYAFTEFRINECQKMDSFSSSSAGTGEKYSKYQFQRYLGKLSVVYHVMDGDDATYSGMAQYYKKQLFGDEASVKKDYYSTVETMGVINGEGLIMGISYNKKIALTTFAQTKAIAEDLKANGFTNMNIKLSGWCNGGYEHGYLDNIKVSKEIGGEDEFTSLLDSLSTSGIGVFPDVDYQYVYATEKTVSKNENSSSLNGARNIISTMYNPINFRETYFLPKYALTVSAMERNLNNFMTSYSQYSTRNVSFRSIGSLITANYREEDFCERQETLENLVSQVKSVKDKDYSIMGSVGDAPFLKYLDVVNELPIVSAGYDKSDYSIPFTAMVLSGRVDYTADAINLSNNDRLDLLQMIEAGSGAYYILTGEQYDDISYTGHWDLYSTTYDNIKESVHSTYKYLSDALSGVYGLAITNHQILADGVNKVTYEDGTSIVVNYNDSDYSAGGITCKAKDYAIIKGV